MIHHLHGEILVLAGVAGCDALIHGLGVDKELEGGAGLAHGRHLIVFPGMEVDVAHPGLDMARLRFHRHEAAMHETHHVADGVHRRQFFLHLTLIIVEYLHGMGLVQVIVDGVFIAVEFLGEVFVNGQSLGNILDETFDFDVALVLPGVCAAPVLVEGLLHLFHLLDGGLLSILLQAGVDSGVDF